ncbi:MAG TPA: flagellar hook basal-body protein [Gemmatimonadales bacterium]|nr:flagellar hook basal-body protein [Gemmatimonadales bacterium]
MGISFRPTGMTASVHALRYWELRQEVAAHNLANVSTDGFKGERAFAQLVEGGHPVIGAATDLSQGSLRPTESPLDIALGDEGFLVVKTPEGERLTRGGSFRFNESGLLVDVNGNPLLTHEGLINMQPRELVPDAPDTDPLIPPEAGGPVVQVNPDGQVYVNGRSFGMLRVERVPQGTALEREASGLYRPTGATEIIQPNERNVRQGMLEESNVTAVASMVDMIAIQRAYANVQKAVTTLDAIRGLLTSEIGRPV